MRRRSKNLTKALRRSKYLLALVVLFGAGAVASGALGMVSLAGGGTTAGATDPTAARDQTTGAPPSTDTGPNETATTPHPPPAPAPTDARAPRGHAPVATDQS